MKLGVIFSCTVPETAKKNFEDGSGAIAESEERSRIKIAPPPLLLLHSRKNLPFSRKMKDFFPFARKRLLSSSGYFREIEKKRK